jgi:hypothetical protein
MPTKGFHHNFEAKIDPMAVINRVKIFAMQALSANFSLTKISICHFVVLQYS